MKIDSITNKFFALKNTNQSEILNVRDQIQSGLEKERTRNDHMLSMAENKADRRIKELEVLVNTLEEQVKRVSKPNAFESSSKAASRSETSHGGLSEVDRKLGEMNESLKRDLKIMDVNIIELFREKDDAIRQLIQDMGTIQTNINIFGDRVLKLERVIEKKIDESQLYKHIEPHLSKRNTQPDIRLNLQASMLSEREYESRIKDLETSFNNIALIEKDIRGKYDLYDLNISSIKRHLELDVAMSIKQSVVPIQKNVEIYLQGVESRISFLEDVVTKEVRRESFILHTDKEQVKHPKNIPYIGEPFIRSVLHSQNPLRGSNEFNANLLESQIETKLEDQIHTNSNRGSQFNTYGHTGGSSTQDQRQQDALKHSTNIQHINTNESVRMDDEEVFEQSQTEDPLPYIANVQLQI